jgi:hypothetical protein
MVNNRLLCLRDPIVDAFICNRQFRTGRFLERSRLILGTASTSFACA